jgi:hypothetical protein
MSRENVEAVRGWVAALNRRDLEALLEIADPSVELVGRLRAKGRTSGLEVERELAWLLDFRAGTGPGRFTRVRYFPTPSEALEAAGLSE